MGWFNDRPTNEHVLNFAFYSFVGFVLVQTSFAIIANSQAMLADSEAMAVDALTYLFNLLAERVKSSPVDSTIPNVEYRRELRRLYLELIPPLISVATLMVITINTVQEALGTWRGEEDEDVSVSIMLIFSAANLLLDVANVTCFARANMMILGISPSSTSEPTETSTLIAPKETTGRLVNLNMCSAWTHVCADTLRSTAVLVAAGISFFSRSFSGAEADSVASLLVSAIIFFSVMPLLHGLLLTAIQIYRLHRNPPSDSVIVV